MLGLVLLRYVVFAEHPGLFFRLDVSVVDVRENEHFKADLWYLT